MKYSEGFRNPPSAYDDSKVYKVGDVVLKDNIIYVMNEGIGAPGYAPPRDPNWKVLPSTNLCNPAPYDNGKIYSVGDVVTKDGIKYILSNRIGIGEAGFPPPKPGNWSPMTEESNRQLQDQLSEIDSTLQVGNLLNLIQTYQMYKVNKNTKSLRE